MLQECFGYLLIVVVGYLLWQFDWTPRRIIPFTLLAGFCCCLLMQYCFLPQGESFVLFQHGSYAPNDYTIATLQISVLFAGTMVGLYLLGRIMVRRWLRE